MYNPFSTTTKIGKFRSKYLGVFNAPTGCYHEYRIEKQINGVWDTANDNYQTVIFRDKDVINQYLLYIEGVGEPPWYQIKLDFTR